MVRVLWCCSEKLEKDQTVGVVVIFMMFSHIKVLLNCSIFVY